MSSARAQAHRRAAAAGAAARAAHRHPFRSGPGSAIELPDPSTLPQGADAVAEINRIKSWLQANGQLWRMFWDPATTAATVKAFIQSVEAPAQGSTPATADPQLQHQPPHSAQQAVSDADLKSLISSLEAQRSELQRALRIRQAATLLHKVVCSSGSEGSRPAASSVAAPSASAVDSAASVLVHVEGVVNGLTDCLNTPPAKLGEVSATVHLPPPSASHTVPPSLSAGAPLAAVGAAERLSQLKHVRDLPGPKVNLPACDELLRCTAPLVHAHKGVGELVPCEGGENRDQNDGSVVVDLAGTTGSSWEPVQRDTSTMSVNPVQRDTSTMSVNPVQRDTSTMSVNPVQRDTSTMSVNPVQRDTSTMSVNPVQRDTSTMSVNPVQRDTSTMSVNPVQRDTSTMSVNIVEPLVEVVRNINDAIDHAVEAAFLEDNADSAKQFVATTARFAFSRCAALGCPVAGGPDPSYVAVFKEVLAGREQCDVRGGKSTSGTQWSPGFRAPFRAATSVSSVLPVDSDGSCPRACLFTESAAPLDDSDSTPKLLISSEARDHLISPSWRALVGSIGDLRNLIVFVASAVQFVRVQANIWKKRKESGENGDHDSAASAAVELVELLSAMFLAPDSSADPSSHVPRAVVPSKVISDLVRSLSLVAKKLVHIASMQRAICDSVVIEELATARKKQLSDVLQSAETSLQRKQSGSGASSTDSMLASLNAVDASVLQLLDEVTVAASSRFSGSVASLKTELTKLERALPQAVPETASLLSQLKAMQESSTKVGFDESVVTSLRTFVSNKGLLPACDADDLNIASSLNNIISAAGSKNRIDAMLQKSVDTLAEIVTSSDDYRQQQANLLHLKSMASSAEAKPPPGSADAIAEEKKNKLAGLISQALCPVCNEDKKDTVLINCWHLLCRKCVQKAWDNRSRMCPRCNAKFVQSDVFDVASLIAEPPKKKRKKTYDDDDTSSSD